MTGLRPSFLESVFGPSVLPVPAPTTGVVPLRLVVGARSGTLVDARARWLAQHLAPALARPVEVDHRPGMAGNLAAAAVAQAPPDGNTLLVAQQELLTVNPHLFAQPGFDPLTQLAPVARLGLSALVLVTDWHGGARDVGEFLQRARGGPQGLRDAGAPPGSTAYMASALLQQRGGLVVRHLPSVAPGLGQLLVGRADFAFGEPEAVLPLLAREHVRALAVTGRTRLCVLPDLPTLDEAGLPGYDLPTWTGLVAPAGTPPGLVHTLNREIRCLLGSAEARRCFEAQGALPGELDEVAFAAFVREQHTCAGRLVRAIGLRIE